MKDFPYASIITNYCSHLGCYRCYYRHCETTKMKLVSSRFELSVHNAGACLTGLCLNPSATVAKRLCSVHISGYIVSDLKAVLFLEISQRNSCYFNSSVYCDVFAIILRCHNSLCSLV